MSRLPAALVSIITLLAAVAARAEQTYSFEPGQALISIEIGPRTSRVAVVTRTLGGRLIEQDGGALRAELKLPLAPFTTGSHSRDADLLASLPLAMFPEATFAGLAAPAGDGKVRFEGTINFAGISRPLTVPVTLVHTSGLLYGHSSFVLHLRDFGIPIRDGASDEAHVEIDAGLRPDRATRG